ncbi:MAG: hypothetical protein WC444_04620 [Candidatus Paceibacterota bacterium]
MNWLKKAVGVLGVDMHDKFRQNVESGKWLIMKIPLYARRFLDNKLGKLFPYYASERPQLPSAGKPVTSWTLPSGSSVPCLVFLPGDEDIAMQYLDEAKKSRTQETEEGAIGAVDRAIAVWEQNGPFLLKEITNAGDTKIVAQELRKAGFEMRALPMYGSPRVWYKR